MGYAQVLVLLSCQIEQMLKNERNTFKQFEHLLDNLQDDHIIYHIIQELLSREQRKLDKFKDTIRDKYIKINKGNIVDSLYNKDEQLFRLQWHDQSDQDIPGDIVATYNELLPEDQEKYLETLTEWLPQHIFLHDNKIMPIFQEYIFAECLLDHHKGIVNEKEFIGRHKLPTLAFADCYLSINGGVVQSEHIYFLVAAYYSQTLVDNQMSCDISPVENDAGDESEDLYLTFDYLHPEGLNKIVPIKIVNTDSHPVILNHAENMSINIPGEIVLAAELMENVEVRQTFIECDNIRFQAPEICFSTYGDEENILVVHKIMEKDANCKIRFLGMKNTKLDIPKKYFHSFYEFHNHLYVYDEDDSSCEDSIEKFVFGLKKVLEQFKTDKYDNGPRKLREKIDSRCQSGIKKRVLDFLKSQMALSEEGIFYQYNISRMNDLHISRAAYMHFNDSRYRKQLADAYKQYLIFMKK